MAENPEFERARYLVRNWLRQVPREIRDQLLYRDVERLESDVSTALIEARPRSPE